MTNIKQALWASLRRSTSRTAAKNVLVRLEACSPDPETPVERVIVSLLAETGPMTLDRLAQRVASELYRDELRRGASVLDIGLFGSRLLVPDVVGEIEARDGTLWRIERRKEP